MTDEIVWDTALHTVYDQTLNEDLPNNMLSYLNGEMTKEAAMKAFYDKLDDVTGGKVTHD